MMAEVATWSDGLIRNFDVAIHTRVCQALIIEHRWASEDLHA
ncbi:hypothetical protein [Variovorax sp. YR266]|nr:hypothetical protein [Variovorax sp. YR266]